MRKIVIIGATSTIAEATARIWAAQGEHLFLVARDEQKLMAIREDLMVRGCQEVFTHVMDGTDLSAHSSMLDSAEHVLHGLDTVLIAYGSLPNQEACQQSVELTWQALNTNAFSVIALLTLIAQRFEKQKKGTIAVISSVAGDRGRTDYVYGTAKGTLTLFLQGLRRHLHRSGVNVLTIKPGFVDTAMTQNFKKGVLWATPEFVANSIVNAIENRRDVIYTPWFWWGIMWLITHIPEKIFKRMSV